jgi:hypothetical protein
MGMEKQWCIPSTWATACEKQLKLVGREKAVVRSNCWKQRFDIWQERF